MRPGRNLLLALSLLGAIAGGCNALWGVDELGYAGPSGDSTTSTGGGGAAGGHGGSGAATTGGAGGSAASGGSAGAGGSPCELGPFGPATPLTEVNTSDGEWDPAVSNNELTLYFSSPRTGGLGLGDIWFATRTVVTDPFGPVQNLWDVNSSYADMDPELAPNELTIYWAVQTPAGTGNLDIWTASRVSVTQAFGTPVELPGVNTIYDDRDPTLSADGLTVYFTSDRPGGAGSDDIWTAQRSGPSAPFGTAQLVSVASTSVADANPALSSDGLALYFDTSASGGAGERDIWVVTRDSLAAPFGAMQNIGVPNTSDGDFDPAISADGRTLYFASNRLSGSGGGDLWRATRSCE
ncbi:MAG: hypothetical protein DRI90_12670 [Deltaproteobacteria bacterium]|nr:MAG: hypothetical protein DRI90_12670 [Deltaproteobacteria bacterium]